MKLSVRTVFALFTVPVGGCFARVQRTDADVGEKLSMALADLGARLLSDRSAIESKLQVR